MGKREEKYKSGQIWQASPPMCWQFLLIFADVDGETPLYAVLSLGTHIDPMLSCPMFHCNNLRRHPNYLYSPRELDHLLGDEAQLMKKRCEFVGYEDAFLGYM